MTEMSKGKMAPTSKGKFGCAPEEILEMCEVMFTGVDEAKLVALTCACWTVICASMF